MKLFISKEPITTIFYNGEENTESVFAIDNNNLHIQEFAHPWPFKVNIPAFQEEIKSCLVSSEIEYIDKGYLFYTHSYEKSYTHYLTQTVPRLTDFMKNYYGYELLVPEMSYNDFSKELFECAGIPEDTIRILRAGHVYIIKDFQRGKYYLAPPDPFTEDHLWIYEHIRKSLSITSTGGKRCIYIKRDGIANTKYGNSETGILRKAINEDDLIRELETSGFEIITLGNRSIREKAELLRGCEVICAPWGANCMNLIFASAPKHFILFGNDRIFTKTYFSDLCEMLNRQSILLKVFMYPCISNLEDKKNIWNYGFEVNVDEICSYLRTLTSKEL
jgi:capsular polysaccharide biosynthesis protein